MKLKDLCSNITDGTHSTVVDSPDGEYFLLSCKNVKCGQIIYGDGDRRINNETLLSLRQRTKLSVGDVVISSVGTIGEVALIGKNPNYEFQRSVAILKPNLNMIEPAYLAYYLSSNEGQSEIKGRIKGAAQPCLFLSDIKDINVSIVPKPEQQHIVNTISSLLLESL